MRFEEVGEQLAVEAFIAEAAVEAFVDSVLPGTAGLDEAGLDARLLQPFLEELGDKLRAVVAAQVLGRPVELDQPASAAMTSRAPIRRLATISRQ